MKLPKSKETFSTEFFGLRNLFLKQNIFLLERLVNVVKVARVINLKLVFTDLFFYKFASTNQVMQSPLPKLRQTSIISKKPIFFDELQL